MNAPSVNILYWHSEDETRILGVYDSWQGCKNEQERLLANDGDFYSYGNFQITGSYWIRNENDDILYGDLVTQ